MTYVYGHKRIVEQIVSLTFTILVVPSKHNAGSMLGMRRRRWTSIEAALAFPYADAVSVCVFVCV